MPGNIHASCPTTGKAVIALENLKLCKAEITLKIQLLRFVGTVLSTCNCLE